MQETTPRPPQFERDAPTKRVYQAWKGNNRFFFGGRLIFGPDVRALFLTLSLILIPAIFFCAFIPQSAIYDCQQHPSNLVLVASSIFTVYILLLLLLTSGRDPGIIPRNACPPELDEDVDSSCLPSDWIANLAITSTILPTKDVVVNGMVIKVKYCHTCMLYRPPRCSHCSICNNCVERFDHHCPWIGQCIGKYIPECTWRGNDELCWKDEIQLTILYCGATRLILPTTTCKYCRPHGRIIVLNFPGLNKTK